MLHLLHLLADAAHLLPQACCWRLYCTPSAHHHCGGRKRRASGVQSMPQQRTRVMPAAKQAVKLHSLEAGRTFNVGEFLCRRKKGPGATELRRLRKVPQAALLANLPPRDMPTFILLPV